MKQWTQFDLNFCHSEGSKRSKNNEKGCQQDWKSRGKLVQNGQKTFLWNIRPTLGQNISGTKYDRDKMIFFMQKEG